MKLRDLTDEQIKELKNCFNFDYKTWAKRAKAHGYTDETLAQHFFSRGISAILATGISADWAELRDLLHLPSTDCDKTQVIAEIKRLKK